MGSDSTACSQCKGVFEVCDHLFATAERRGAVRALRSLEGRLRKNERDVAVTRPWAEGEVEQAMMRASAETWGAAALLAGCAADALEHDDGE
jgi:hypothetical protein